MGLTTIEISIKLLMFLTLFLVGTRRHELKNGWEKKKTKFSLSFKVKLVYCLRLIIFEEKPPSLHTLTTSFMANFGFQGQRQRF